MKKLAFLISFLPLTAFAETASTPVSAGTAQPPVVTPWSGAVEFGLIKATGNTRPNSVNGKARIKLYKGHCRVVGRDSAADSLFNVDFATFEADEVYNQADAEGFIKLNALRLRIAAIQRQNRK